MKVTVKAGWADKLKVGSIVLVQDRVVPEDRPSSGYRLGTVERVSATEVVVDGVKYRRGIGRSPLIQYPNEGLEVKALNDPQPGRIWPTTAPVRNEFNRLAIADITADVERASSMFASPTLLNVLAMLGGGDEG